MATLEELVVRIKADATELEKEFKRVQGITEQGTKKIKDNVSELGLAFRGLLPALSAAALVAWTKQTIDAAGRVVDLSQQIGFAGSTLTALEASLAATGVTLEEFASIVNLMNSNIGQAVSQIDGPAAQAFQRLGLSVEELKRLSPEEQFYAIADALSQVGTQYEQTELGRAIFGRGFAKLLPLIKEADGDLKGLADTLKKTEGVTKESLDAIDQFGDAWTKAAITARNAWLETLGAILQAGQAAQGALNQARLGNVPKPSSAGVANDNGPYGPFQATGKLYGPFETTGDQYGPKLKEQTKNTRELSQATQAFLDRMEQAQQIYDQTRTPLERYNERVAEALELYNEGLITLDTFNRVQDEAVDSMEKTGDAAVVSARLIKDSFADALESAIFDFKNFGNAANGILEGIARNIARSRIIDPLSNSATSLLDGLIGSVLSTGSYGGFSASDLDVYGYADGGRPPVGRPSIVGERGPEIFVPDSAGTIIPNGKGMGGSVTVVNTWNIQSGVTRQELAALIPTMEARTTAAVIAAAERGGRVSQVLGKRN